MIVINPGLICIIYVRVSTRRQANHRVQDEIDLCQELAMKHSLTVMEIFVDAGSTGFTDEREAYKKMLACIREHKGRLQYVIVPDVSRAWRNFPEYIALRATAAMHGVQIISAREGAIDGTIEGQLIEDTLAFAASYQARTKKELSAKAQKDMVERGLWPFRAPLGYQHGRLKGYLVPDEDAAPAIRRLFKLVGHESVSVADLSSGAVELGLFRGEKPLSSCQQYRRILANPLYAGRIVLASGLTAMAQFPPLVDGATFDAAQAQLAGRGGIRRNGAPRLPLSGFVICVECGYALSGSYAKGVYGWYRCRKACAKLRDSDFHEMFIRFADALVVSVGMSAEVTEIALCRTGSGRGREKSKLDMELEAIRLRKDQLIKWRQDGSIRENEWQRAMARND